MPNNLASSKEGKSEQNRDRAKRKGKKQAVFFALALAALIVWVGIASSYRLVVSRHVLRSSKINNPLRMLLVADLHSCRYGEGQTELVQAIDKLNPDILMLCGDIADDDLPIGNTEKLLAAVADRYPCFYVSGNHEYWSGEIESIKRLVRRYGVKILEGEYTPLAIREEKIIICGVDDPESGNFMSQLERAAKGTAIGPYTVLLSHRPERFAQYVPFSFDLVLSGHAHGGLWRIPGLLDGLAAPNQGFFPRYTNGSYREQSTTMIVSRGLARESTRLPRFFNPTELVIIDLQPDENLAE